MTEPTMTIQEQMDAYIVFLKDQQIVNDSMTFSEKVQVTSDYLYQWMQDRDIYVVFNGPRKIVP